MADVASPNSVAGNPNGGARIGRPPQWTESRSRKLARLYMYTTLPMEKIIKALFPNDDVKKNSAQKTLHKMVGHDPRPLRPVTRADMNTRFKLLHKRSQRRRQSNGTAAEQEEEGVTAVKPELNTPAFSEISGFDDSDTLRSPLQDGRFDLASPSTLASASPGTVWSAFPKDDVELPFQAPFPRPPRNDTVFTNSTQMSTDSVKNLRNRIRVSTVFAKQVSVLMSRLTIGSSENIGTSPGRSPSDFPAHHSHDPAQPGPLLHPGLAVPGDFMIARKYVMLCNAGKHYRKRHGESECTCWCEIADEIADLPEAFYITERGDTCDAAANTLQTSDDADRFGNTPLHLFAALDSPRGIQTTLQLINSRWTNPLAVNKAGQTFLHTLSPSWFSGADDLSAPLYVLLNTLYLTHKDLVFRRDVYGRTFFHQLQRHVHDPQIISNIVQHYTWSPIPRDAFGVAAPFRTVDQSFLPPRRTGTIVLSPLAEETPEDNYAARDSTLAAIVIDAYNNPAIEDDNGRNGFHCLAEMNFSSSNPSSPGPSSPDLNNPKSPVSTKGSLKRKHGKDDVDKPISKRLQFLRGLLTPVTYTQSPDVNHYDKQGNTVLMAFATHLLDEQDDKTGQNIGKILDLLLENGANIDARNRRGETALLIAARCGNKHVVSNLLDRGANLYARDKYGRGVMAIIDTQISQSSKDLPSYGRLEAVRAAVLAKKLEERGGNDEPSFLDEWCWPQRRQTSQDLTR
ncbi:hypothetical protein VMCG_05381 [Cytospora schulzeri]|uniref:Uncharacterized protein n=1 Tax=Cytospora schulzeri TaxID=448051 RepID=A0A423WK77_9PEZI|nr:hypothetical protein VMCG_05381 [Valsa malicola]